MQISKLLLKRQLRDIETEFRFVQSKLNQDESPEIYRFHAHLEKYIVQIEKLKTRLQNPVEQVDSDILQLCIKELKQDLRLVQRRWRRSLVNESRKVKRIERRQERIETVAA